MATGNENNSHKPADHKEISRKLQSEVDFILTNVDEKTLFAEFRQEEIFDIYNGDRTEVIRHTLDERISFGPKRRETAIVKIDRTTAQAARKIGALGRIMNYLFKPLHY